MSENWIKKWYKDSFQQSSTEGPKDEVWQHLDSQLEDWMGSWYTSNAEMTNQKPSLRVWHNLNRFVEKTADQRRYTRSLRYKSMSIALAFLLIPFFFVDTTALVIENIISENSSETNGMIETKSNSIASLSDKTLLIASNNTSNRIASLPSNSLMIDKPLTSKHGTGIKPSGLKSETGESNSILSIRPLHSSSTLAINPKTNHKPMKFSNWRIGGSVSMQRSNLLNPTTFRGYKNQSNITNIRDSYVVLNAQISRKISPLSSIALTVSINDRKSQKYLDFVGSKYIEKSLSLNYQTVRLAYTRKLLPNRLNGRISMEASGGVYGSFRTGVSELWAGEERNFMSAGFKKFDLGLHTELNSIYTLNESVDLTMGLYASNGVINIFNGIDNIPANFYRTFTTSIGASVGLRFAL